MHDVVHEIRWFALRLKYSSTYNKAARMPRKKTENAEVGNKNAKAGDEKEEAFEYLLNNVPSNHDQNTNLHQGLAMIHLLNKNCKKMKLDECKKENDYCTWVEDTFWGKVCLNKWAHERMMFEKGILTGELPGYTIDDVQKTCISSSDERMIGYCNRFIAECNAIRDEAVAFDKKFETDCGARCRSQDRFPNCCTTRRTVYGFCSLSPNRLGETMRVYRQLQCDGTFAFCAQVC